MKINLKNNKYNNIKKRIRYLHNKSICKLFIDSLHKFSSVCKVITYIFLSSHTNFICM